MHRHFEDQLKELKELLVEMGRHVEESIDLAIEALIQRKPENFAKVHELENFINQAHITVDEACVRLLARQSPLAADLRLVVAIIKINTDLERMGDQAVNIAYNGEHYLKQPALKPLIDIPKMAGEAKAMVHDSLQAFLQLDPILAQKVLGRDDTVDSLKDKIFQDLSEVMSRDSTSIERALNLILIARNLERLGDHATNIAEDVIYVCTGKDIRHIGSLKTGT